MRIHFYRLLISIVVISYSSSLFAQTHAVKGNVKDAESGFEIPGATILEKGTTNGTTTDIDGNYAITVSSPNASIEVSFVGYKTLSIPINYQKVINITLSLQLTELDEIVVIGYGTQKKKVVTGAIATVSAEDINSTPILRVDQAMQGRTAGVQVTNLSGQPGEAPTVRIRGAGTTGNAEPLYIIDGMQGNIESLNPGDIESMDVLKDAASSAIYGARAANGVVLITTKSGKKGEMSVTYSGYHGIQNVAKTIDMLNAEQYKMIWYESRRNSNIPITSDDFDLNEIPKHNTNWQDYLFQKNAPMLSHELSVSGGNDKSTYASSMAYFSQQGIIGGDKSQFDRYSGRLNTLHQGNDNFRFGSNLAYSHIIRRGIGSNQSFNGAYSSALNIDPLTPLYEEDANILAQNPYASEPVVKNSDGKVYGISKYIGAEIVNPMALLQIQNAETNVDKIVGNVFGELKVVEGLKANTSLGIDLSYVTDDSFRPLFYLNGAQLNVDKTSVSKSIKRYYTWQWENTIAYTKIVDEHSFSVLAGTTASKFSYEDLAGFNALVPVTNPDHVYLNMATDSLWKSSGGAFHSALLSTFGRVTYDYKNKYAFTGIIRRDGSSKFGPNNRYGIFPSLGVSWVISDEDFMQNINPFNFIKVRASWGINGNQEIGDYQFISLMDYSRSYIFGGGRIIGASPSFIENKDIRWEESEQIDIAVDMGAFSNRLTASIDYYIKTTSGLLERIPIPAHVGNNPPFANVGSVQNKGVELSLNWRHLVRGINYSVGLNGAYNLNKMTKIGNDEGALSGATWAVAGVITRAEVGLPIGYFWGYKTAGIFQNQPQVFQHIGKTGQVLQPDAKPGDVRFVDVNNDGKLDADDRTMIGNPTPDLTFGINGSIEFKNFDFSILAIGSYGNDIFNGAQRQDLFYTNRTTAILDRWTEAKPSDTTPRVVYYDVNRNNRVSDLYVEDGSYIKLKNVQLGYTLPAKLQKTLKAKSLRFYISVENLATITNYTGADPEIGAMSSLDIGIDRGIYPQARIFRFGTTMTF